MALDHYASMYCNLQHVAKLKFFFKLKNIIAIVVEDLTKICMHLI